MTDAFFAPLPNRGLIFLSGEGAIDFLQGLVTNDVAPVGNGKAVYAALLTPQGKYLHDFLIFSWRDGIAIDCVASRREDLVRRLSRYRLRAPIGIDDMENSVEAFAVFGQDGIAQLDLPTDDGQVMRIGNGVGYADPRKTGLGARTYFPTGEGAGTLNDAGIAPAAPADYDALRIGLGVTDGVPEMEPEKSYPMDYGLDALHGISFTKGCYVGQEVTARMKSRALVRRRLIAVDVDGAPPPVGAALTVGSESVGELRAIAGDVGLALVKTDILDEQAEEPPSFEADGTRLQLRQTT